MADSNHPICILAVDDNQESLYTLTTLLEHNHYNVLSAHDGAEALERIHQTKPDIILMDVNMPKSDGFETTEKIRAHPVYSDIPIILLTSRDHIDDVRRGLRLGATDYIKKPFANDELLSRLEVVKQKYLSTESLYGTERTGMPHEGLIGRSKEMEQVYELIDRLKDADVSVVVTGESGTGKELVVRAIHGNSARAQEPLITQNCSALSDTLLESELFGHIRGAFTGAIRDKKGLFEIAHKGTLFLDELGEMSAHLQAKLLRVLQEGTFTPVGSHEERKVDVRVLSATHRDLEQLVKDGAFREDLYYRLNVVHIHLPPLRRRIEDLHLMIRHFLEQHEKDNVNLSSEALQLLEHYTWPGNIRELRNEIERIVALSTDLTAITPHHLSPKFTNASKQAIEDTDDTIVPLKEAVAVVEQKMISRALRETSGNKSEAARLLDISRSSLIQKVKLYFGDDES